MQLDVTETRTAAGWPSPMVIDLVAAEDAAAQFLLALGVDLTTEHSRGTAARMAAAYAELLTPREFTPTSFAHETVEAHHELVIVRRIHFASVCAHHMLPFSGQVSVGYLPGDRVMGLSKLARLVAACAARPQIQETLAQQIATGMQRMGGARGVGVVVIAEHACMTVRGAQAWGSTAVTPAYRGVLCDDRALRAEFLALAGQADLCTVTP